MHMNDGTTSHSFKDDSSPRQVKSYHSPTLIKLSALEKQILGGDPHISNENDSGFFGS